MPSAPAEGSSKDTWGGPRNRHQPKEAPAGPNLISMAPWSGRGKKNVQGGTARGWWVPEVVTLGRGQCWEDAKWPVGLGPTQAPPPGPSHSNPSVGQKCNDDLTGSQPSCKDGLCRQCWSPPA